jgi:hypothetical protein
MNLLSRSEFLVTSCRGADDVPTVSAYGFDGHEDWEEQFGQSLQPPTYALAPAAGRFAMSRLVASAGGSPVSGMAPTDPLTQEIRVYQTTTGDMLLHVVCTPAARTAENFDIAPDGMSLAVLGRETLDVYRLRELSARDRKDLEEATTMQPPLAKGPVDLHRISRPVAEDQTMAAEDGSATEAPAGAAPAPTAAAKTATPAEAPAAAAPAPSATAGVTPSAPATAAKASRDQSAAATAAGDAEPAAPRKPPTLLNPGETVGSKPPAAPK